MHNFNCPDQLTSRFEIKAVTASGEFEGYASVFDAVDDGKDSVQPGAFARSIRERGTSGIKLLWQHDPGEPVGLVEQLFEDARGLFVKGRLLLDVARAKEALSLMRAGALDGLSIGFRTLKSRTNSAGVRELMDLDLWEVSLVTFPMQQQARILSFKSRTIQTKREYEAFLRDAGGFSRNEAKALVTHGFDGLKREREAGDNWGPILRSLEELHSIIQH